MQWGNSNSTSCCVFCFRLKTKWITPSRRFTMNTTAPTLMLPAAPLIMCRGRCVEKSPVSNTGLLLAKIEHKQYWCFFIAVLRCTVKVSSSHAPYSKLYLSTEFNYTLSEQFVNDRDIFWDLGRNFSNQAPTLTTVWLSSPSQGHCDLCNKSFFRSWE